MQWIIAKRSSSNMCQMLLCRKSLKPLKGSKFPNKKLYFGQSREIRKQRNDCKLPNIILENQTVYNFNYSVKKLNLSRFFSLSYLQQVSDRLNINSHSIGDTGRKKTRLAHLSSTPTYYYTFPLIVGMQDVLISIHDITHLPWWATIVLTTILLRFSITLPLARIQAITLAKVELLQPTLKEVMEALKHNIFIKGKRSGKSVEEIDRSFRQEARKYTYDIYKREKCNPLKLYFLPWVQLPLWILVSLALRNISGYFPKEAGDSEICICTEMKTEGLLWLTDLTVSDPYFILPVIIGATNLMNIELNTLKRRAPTQKQQILTRIFRFLTVGMVFVASQVPSAMSLYWATSSTYGFVQNLFILNPAIRRKLGVPKAPSESSAPFMEKAEILKSRFQKFMQIQRK